jgi:hypothetical protein
MALINCPECHAEISNLALQCPKCGAPKTAHATDSRAEPTLSDISEAHPQHKTTKQEDFYEYFIGHRNTDFYLAAFKKFDAGNGVVSWNWPAFFLTLPWLLYRKMWLNAILYWLLVPIVSAFLGLLLAGVSEDPDVAVLGYYGVNFAISFLFVPMISNRLYYVHARSKIQKIVNHVSDADDQLRRVSQAGGTSSAGAIAVTIFIVVALIGILAAIAIPAYQDYTIRAQVSEGVNLSAGAKAAVTEYYLDTRQFPANNDEAGLLPPEEIHGNYVSSAKDSHLLQRTVDAPKRLIGKWIFA